MRVLLFSGGIDSSALAYWLRPDVCLTVDYGHRPASGEVAAAASICSELGLRHEVIFVDLRHLGSGSLAGTPVSGLARAEEWWPYRNQMLITLAGMRFLSEGLREIVIGAVSTDVHSDGRSPFLRGISRLMSLQEGQVAVLAPARRLSPERLLDVSEFPADLLGLTFSCHTMEFPCGTCRGCIKHAELSNYMRRGAR
ncbi:7-cyano-7-deazaguanine synthase [Rhodopseudomonas sp. BR0G17]|nr:7-cyano-7-deazaguanine synthase [Rhodopseudomonas sp. BR0G17]